MNSTLSKIALLLALTLTGCTVGPDYARPELNLPESFKEMPAGWKLSEPADNLPRSDWWSVYNDPVLSSLVSQIEISNQNVKVAEARYRQALAATEEANAAFFPTLSASASKTRNRSAGSTSSGKESRGSFSNSNSVSLSASWVPDIWGAVRRSAESSNASDQASAAQLAAAKLSAQTTLTQNYLQLRIIDRQRELLAQSIAAYERSLTLTQNKLNVGLVTPSDAAQAQSQLKSAQAQAIELKLSRTQLEHAIAILLGKAPAQFELPADDNWRPAQPQIPATLSSHLLERRPDVAAAERSVASANAMIGVAQAAYYPSLTLNASGGYQSGDLTQWFNVPGRVWALGASVAELIFDGGKRAAHKEGAIAAYDATVAQYKQTVLSALQNVEDNLAVLHYLKEESIAQNDALIAAREAERLISNQYKAGMLDYLSVTSAQSTLYSAQNNALQLQGRQLSASVLLISALGGGWDGNLTPQIKQSASQ